MLACSYDIDLPLDDDIQSNATLKTQLYGTPNPNKFLPFFCNTNLAVAACDYSAWTGSRNDFDLLGANGVVPLVVTSGAIDRSNYVRLELSWQVRSSDSGSG